MLEVLKKHQDKGYGFILDILISHEIIILYSNGQTDSTESAKLTVDFKDSLDSILNSSFENQEDLEDNSSEEQKEENDQRKFSDDLNKSSSFAQALESNYVYDEVLPRRFTSDGEYFKNEHAVEIMFRSRYFSEQEESDIIVKLYGNFRNIGRQDSRLIKLFTIYNKF